MKKKKTKEGKGGREEQRVGKTTKASYLHKIYLGTNERE